jgi:hypothetical protein
MHGLYAKKLPPWFWMIGTLALLWNLAGLAAFVAHLMVTPDAIAQLPPAQAKLYTEAPEWLNVAFAIAVVGGVLASVMLLLRNITAVMLYSVSLLGVLAQNSYRFLMSDAVDVLGQGAMAMPLLVITLSVVLLGYSLALKNRGWLR